MMVLCLFYFQIQRKGQSNLQQHSCDVLIRTYDIVCVCAFFITNKLHFVIIILYLQALHLTLAH